MSTDTANPASPAKADVPHEVVVTCPATGKVVGRVPVTTSVEVEAVAARLRAAQPAWQQLGVDGRARWLGKWRDWLIDHTDELLTLLQLETGKSWGDTNIEIAGVQIINYWIDNAAEFLADENCSPVRRGQRSQEADHCLRALSTRRNDHTVERPALGAAGRHCAGVDGRLRRAVQTLGVHPAWRGGWPSTGGSRSVHRKCSTRCTGSAKPGQHWSIWWTA